MITRKTLRQANAQKGHFDAEKLESLTDADIDRMTGKSWSGKRRLCVPG
jgi:hypothetical protein